MTTSSAAAALRDRLLAVAPAPASDAHEGARLAEIARAMDFSGLPVARVPELRVRVSGPGIDGHAVDVKDAARILERVQDLATAVGSATLKRQKVSRLKGPNGKRIGVGEATRLRLSPTVAPGSVIFTLSGASPTVDEAQDGVLPETASDSLLDVAIRDLIGTIETAQADASEDMAAVTEALRKGGPLVTSRFNSLATVALKSDVDIELRHWSTAGRRDGATLRKRGARAIAAAAERNKIQRDTGPVVGKVRTVSDGADRLRITLPTGVDVLVPLDDDSPRVTGDLLGRKVLAMVETVSTWNLTTGRATHKRRLISISPAE